MSYEDESSDYEDSAGADAYLDESSISEDELVDEDADVHRGIRSKDRNTEHALEVRRAIEDHLDRTRLQKDLDYLFDEDFTGKDSN